MWECRWQSLHKPNTAIKAEKFPYKRHLSEARLLQQIIGRRLFGYVQCDNELPQHLKNIFLKYAALFKSTLVSRTQIGNLMEKYAKKQKRKVLLHSLDGGFYYACT